mmetsp:Transcript_52918/g.104427  ORF Transcript_52918/g.104427 Transcript_52918/m.104427 type:complete len:425 (+) Transcript_52918:42-1316(+)
MAKKQSSLDAVEIRPGYLKAERPGREAAEAPRPGRTQGLSARPRGRRPPAHAGLGSLIPSWSEANSPPAANLASSRPPASKIATWRRTPTMPAKAELSAENAEADAASTSTGRGARPSEKAQTKVPLARSATNTFRPSGENCPRVSLDERSGKRAAYFESPPTTSPMSLLTCKRSAAFATMQSSSFGWRVISQPPAPSLRAKTLAGFPAPWQMTTRVALSPAAWMEPTRKKLHCGISHVQTRSAERAFQTSSRHSSPDPESSAPSASPQCTSMANSSPAEENATTQLRQARRGILSCDHGPPIGGRRHNVMASHPAGSATGGHVSTCPRGDTMGWRTLGMLNEATPERTSNKIVVLVEAHQSNSVSLSGRNLALWKAGWPQHAGSVYLPKTSTTDLSMKPGVAMVTSQTSKESPKLSEADAATK